MAEKLASVRASILSNPLGCSLLWSIAFARIKRERLRRAEYQKALYRRRNTAKCPRWHLTEKEVAERRVLKRVRCGLRIRLGRFLTGKLTFSLSKLVGCSPDHLKTHLESQFKPGMTWENYGSAWHVDHIVPLAHFDLTDTIQREAAANWKNLQPLFAVDNLRKNDSVPEGVTVPVPVVMLDHLDAIISKQELEREITAKMVADYVAGIGIRTLSTRYSVPKTTVQRRLKAAGVYVGSARWHRTNAT